MIIFFFSKTNSAHFSIACARFWLILIFVTFINIIKLFVDRPRTFGINSNMIGYIVKIVHFSLHYRQVWLLIAIDIILSEQILLSDVWRYKILSDLLVGLLKIVI